MTISIIDYGMGNLRSVQKGFEKIGEEAKIIHSPREVLDAGALVLPGVGAFKKCFQNLESLNLIPPILQSIKSGKPFMGICLGLQILFSKSEEFGDTPGLDVIKGKVVRFQKEQFEPRTENTTGHFKIPHMGWNTISLKKTCPHLKNIEENTFFYFVHSYYVVPEETDLIATTTSYRSEFVSSIWKDNIFACQFHPEKSQTVGLKVLKNFTAIAQ